MKLGDNIISWRSSTQPRVAKITADSAVAAMAPTAILGELVNVLRVSMMIPTPIVEIPCDNRAAIVLAIGEGS